MPKLAPTAPSPRRPQERNVRPFLPAPLIAASLPGAPAPACPRKAEVCSLDRLRRTRLSPLEIWASPRFRIAWKLWAIRNYGNQRQQKQANKYKAPDNTCPCSECASQSVIRTTSKFLQLFPKPPAYLLALCKEPK